MNNLVLLPDTGPREDVSTVEREPLFPDDEQDTTIANTMDVTRKVSAIKLIEQQIAMFERQDSESRAFYAAKVAQCEQRIEFMKQAILGWLQFNKLKNIQSPAGTAYRKVITTKHWPTDDELLAWATNNLPDAIRINREPDKRAIGEHIRQTGNIPEGYRETQTTKLYIKS